MKGTDRMFFMTFRNMIAVRLCLVFVLFLCVDRIAGKPIFDFDLLCYFACDDDDVSTTTTSSSDEDWWGCDCRPRRRRTTTTMAPPVANPINMSFGNGSGMNMTMIQTGQTFSMLFVPVMSAPAPAMAPASAPASAPGSPPVAPAVPGPTAAGPAAPAAATTAATTAAG